MEKFMARALKIARTFEEQVQILESRKLNISCCESAKAFLTNNNYYRVSAYFKPYYNIETDEEFKDWVTIEHVNNLYMFDSELRKLMLPILEKSEVAFRTHLAYYFAHEKGALGYQDRGNFYDNHFHRGMMNNIGKVTNNPKEKFLQFYKNNYDDQYPIWVLIEALTFGTISKFYGNMKNADKAKLSRQFYNGLDRTFLENWIQVLVVARNICAHHGRMFNREIMLPLIRDDMRDKILPGYEKRVFSVMLICKEIIRDESMWNHFVYELMYLIDKYEFTHYQAMGLPEEWQQHFVSSPLALKRINTKLFVKKKYDIFENKIKSRHL
jgi:abortive infection bacteriophage resistance protein